MASAWQRVLRALIIATIISIILFYSARQFGPAPVSNTIHDRPDDQHKPFQPPAPKPDEEPPLISLPPLGKPTPASPSTASSEGAGVLPSSTSPVAPVSSSSSPSSVPASGTIPGIPGKIWQTSKHANLTNEQSTMTNTWLAKNPTFRHELLTDESSDDYVRSRYAEHKDIVALYTGLTIPIIRADLLRYLILLAEGGIWADLDTTCDEPVSSWLPAETYKANSTIKTGLVVGLEPDADHGGRKVFTSGVFAAQPGSKHIKVIVDDIVRELYDIAKQKSVGPEGITLEMISDVVEVTGRKKMTAKIIESLSKTLHKEISDTDLTSDSKEPRYLDDVVVLPVPAFASYDGNPKPHGEVLVTHHHAGTWKSAAEAAKKNREKQLKEEADRLEKAAQEAERKQKEEDAEKKKEEDRTKKAKEDGERQRKEDEAKQTKEKQERREKEGKQL
ncbi:hypothetical protein MauCBS54593_007573 [Microsporum audouinii]